MSAVFSDVSLNDNEEICLPTPVTGRVTTAATLTAAAMQIDDGEPVDIGEYCDPPLSETPAITDFAIDLTRFDCPFPDTYYMLTLLFWDSGAEPTLTQENIPFKVKPANECE